MWRAVVIALVLSLAACGSEPEPEPEPVAPEATPTPKPTRFHGKPVRVRAADGKVLKARIAEGGAAKAPAVIVLHTSNNARETFDGLAASLHDEGYTVLALETRDKFHSLREVTEDKNETGVARDVLAGAKRLRDAPRVGVVAQSMGALGTVLALADGNRAIDATVALSPPDSASVLDLQTKNRYRPNGVLFVADDVELQSSANLADGARGSEVWQAPLDGHGYELLADDRVRDRTFEWLDARLGAPPDG